MRLRREAKPRGGGCARRFAPRFSPSLRSLFFGFDSANDAEADVRERERGREAGDQRKRREAAAERGEATTEATNRLSPC